ncbi:MAG: hypothetical protein U5N86_08035 [Planctomycetota bacterium]|nr:hypothetical protein [Planctomycetota bacterium]
MLNYLLSHTEKEIRSNLTIPHPELHPRVTYYDMMQRPKDVRGATVILQGKVRLYGYMEYDPEFQREAGIHGCWYGNLFDKHGNQFAFRVLKDGQKFKEADTLTMYAVFLKKIWMLNRRGQQRGMAEYSIMPFCVARTAEHFVYESESLFSGESIAFFVAFALLVIVFGLTLGREITRSLSRRFG